MIPSITAFKASPDRGQGLARDMRVRWALEEVGQPYHVRLATFDQLKAPEHRRLNPFGQIPTYEMGELALFETGSILMEIAAHHSGLLPDEPDAKARAITWMFAAISTVEYPILELATAKLLEGKQDWTEQRLPLIHERIRTRLRELTIHLGERDWLDGGFSAADIMMVHVLLRLSPSGLLGEFPTITAYTRRAQERPAYQRAFAAQLAVFKAGADQGL